MKKALSFAVLALFLSSCSLTTFTTSDLSSNYELGMTGKKEKALKEKIPVYLSEKQISSGFSIISVNRYTPWVLPVLGNVNKKIKKHLYEKAVKTAEKQGGNAVLIVDDTHFKVLSVK